MRKKELEIIHRNGEETTLRKIVHERNVRVKEGSLSRKQLIKNGAFTAGEIDQFVKDGRLTKHRVGRKVYFNEREVQDCIAYTIAQKRNLFNEHTIIGNAPPRTVVKECGKCLWRYPSTFADNQWHAENCVYMAEARRKLGY